MAKKRYKKLLPLTGTIFISLSLSSCSILEDTKTYFRQQDAIVAYNDAVDEINSRHYQQAYPKLLKANQLDPDNESVNKALGRVLIGLGKAQSAIPYLEKAWSEDKSDSGALLTLTNAYEANSQFAKAADCIEQFMKLYPDKQPSEIKDRLKSLRKQQEIYDRVSKLPGGLSSDNYFAYATMESGIARWPSRRMPLAVYIEKTPGIKGYKTSLHALVMKACQTWQNESKGTVKFRPAESLKEAQIHCRFFDDPGKLGNREAGETITTTNLSGLTNSFVKILTVDRQTGGIQADSELYLTALHELGHAIGIDGHSPDSKDVMFYSETDSDADTGTQITRRDIKTLSMIYASSSAYIPPKGSSREREVEKIRAYNAHVKIYNQAVAHYNAGKYREAIAAAQSYLEFEPNSKFAKELIKHAEQQLNSP